MKHQEPSRRRPQEDPILYPRPRCPGCGHWRMRITKPVAQGDASTLRYVRCHSCDRPSRYVLDPTVDSIVQPTVRNRTEAAGPVPTLP